MTKELEKLKKNLLQKIRKINIKEIITIGIIGSFQYSKRLEKYNDIDIFIIVDKLTPNLFNEIKKKFTRISKSLESKTLKFVIETRRGPIKPNPLKEKKLIQLHILITDLNIYKKTVKETILYDTAYFSTLIKGTSPRILRKINRISKKTILNELDKHIEEIENKTIHLNEYVILKDQIKLKSHRVKIPKKEQNEEICHHTIISFIDYARYKKHKTKKVKKNMLITGKKILESSQYKKLENFITIKEKIRAGKKLVKTDSLKLRSNAIIFIRELKKSI